MGPMGAHGHSHDGMGPMGAHGHSHDGMGMMDGHGHSHSGMGMMGGPHSAGGAPTSPPPASGYKVRTKTMNKYMKAVRPPSESGS